MRRSSASSLREVSWSGIENLPETCASTSEVASDRAFRDPQPLSDTLWIEVGPICEHNDGPLPHAEPRHGKADIGPQCGQLPAIDCRGACLKRPTLSGATQPPASLVVDSAVEVSAMIGDPCPAR